MKNTFETKFTNIYFKGFLMWPDFLLMIGRRQMFVFFFHNHKFHFMAWHLIIIRIVFFFLLKSQIVKLN